MDIVTGAGTAAKAVGPAVSGTRAAIRWMRLRGTYDLDWLQLADGVEFSAAEVSDIGNFLANDDVRPLLSLLALTLLTPECRERAESIDTIKGGFENAAKRWNIAQNSGWSNRIEHLWQPVLSVYNTGLPDVGHEVASAASEFKDFVKTPLGSHSRGEKDGTVRYVERLSDLASDLGRVGEAMDTASRIKEALADVPIAPIITYTETSRPATFNDLYVSRSLATEDGVDVDSSDLGSGGPSFRAVVQGAPGAGKSTFVRHLRQELAAGSGGQAVLLMTVRHYFNFSRNQSNSPYSTSPARNQTIHEYLWEATRSNLSIRIDKEALRDALTLGAAVVVFDGLDEITDINLRAEMVERIVAFAREFPATSILVTSRAVGYERAPLPSRIFTVLTLDQYTAEQTQEYVSRWFKFIERPELVAEFNRESDTVGDLRTNPLLLSLLCVLYRERGSIPRRRRDIYASCADLLFHTWDSHRHIGQPEELHANGDRIMQEIARWVYTTPSAQSGLSESVIQKCIGNYLRDTVGVEDGEARRRASEFLEFCANRAWLLANTGNQYGERVFGFTHRTFFEFFAAEAFARQSASPEKIAEHLVAAHERDATSVLPELLLQAFDEKVERGAAEAFKIICETGRDDALILRLMEGVPLPSRTRHTGFDAVLRTWSESRSVKEASFTALLSLNSDARCQFIDETFDDGESNPAATLFLKLWAALDLGGRSARFEPTWGDAVLRYAGLHQAQLRRVEDPVLQLWLWSLRLRDLPMVVMRDQLVLDSLLGARSGPLWLVVHELSMAPDRIEEGDIAHVVTVAESFAKRPRARIPFVTANAFSACVLERWSQVPLGKAAISLPDGSAKWVVLYVVAILDESGGIDDFTEELFKKSFGEDVKLLLRSREVALGTGSFESLSQSARARDRVRQFPVWLRSWSKGTRSFVASFSE